jgi:hypothetical protein
VTFNRCHFLAVTGWDPSPFNIAYYIPGASAVFTDCTFDGAQLATSPGGQGVLSFFSYTLLRCKVVGGPDQLRVGAATRVEDSYIGSPVKALDTQHCDGIQTTGMNGDLVIKNNTIHGDTIVLAGGGGVWGTAVILKADTADIAGTVLLEGNFITGGIYALQARQAGTNLFTASLTLTNNVLAKGSFRDGTTDINIAGTVTSSGNLYDDGTSIPGLG